MSSELTQRIAQEHAAAAESLPSGVVARARRRRAIEALVARGLPTSRDENWRYASLRPLERVRFAPAATTAVAPAGAPVATRVTAAAQKATAEKPAASLAAGELPPPIPGYARYVFIDGILATAASERVSPRPGVTVHTARAATLPADGSPARTSLATRASGEDLSVGHAADGHAAPGRTTDDAVPAGQAGAEGALPALGDGDSAPESAFALLNEAFAVDSAEIEVASPAEAAPEEPVCIEVVFVASAPAQQGASYPRLRVTAAPRARLRLVERHVSVGSDASFVDADVEIQAHDGASIDHYRVQQLGARAVWIDTLSASVGRSAAYRLHGIGLGAQSARSTVRVHLRGDGAELALHVVAAGDRQQVLDQYAVVDHAAPRTRTEESFRGIAAGRSRVAFNGKIIVRPGAHGADSSQSLRGLLAGAEAEVDVRPQLEIYNDDVRCSHGATAGKLDETMLFYLLSRGLDREAARRLLEWAFLEDVVSRIAVVELRRQIELSLAGQIQESDALKELLHGRDRA